MVHPNDHGDQVRQCGVGNGRGSPRASRPRTKERWRQARSRKQEGRRLEESWKEEPANNIELGLGPTQGHSLHSKGPMISVSKHKKTPKKQGLL